MFRHCFSDGQPCQLLKAILNGDSFRSRIQSVDVPASGLLSSAYLNMGALTDEDKTKITVAIKKICVLDIWDKEKGASVVDYRPQFLDFPPPEQAIENAVKDPANANIDPALLARDIAAAGQIQPVAPAGQVAAPVGASANQQQQGAMDLLCPVAAPDSRSAFDSFKTPAGTPRVGAPTPDNELASLFGPVDGPPVAVPALDQDLAASSDTMDRPDDVSASTNKRKNPHDNDEDSMVHGPGTPASTGNAPINTPEPPVTPNAASPSFNRVKRRKRYLFARQKKSKAKKEAEAAREAAKAAGNNYSDEELEPVEKVIRSESKDEEFIEYWTRCVTQGRPDAVLALILALLPQIAKVRFFVLPLVTRRQEKHHRERILSEEMLGYDLNFLYRLLRGAMTSQRQGFVAEEFVPAENAAVKSLGFKPNTGVLTKLNETFMTFTTSLSDRVRTDCFDFTLPLLELPFTKKAILHAPFNFVPRPEVKLTHIHSLTIDIEDANPDQQLADVLRACPNLKSFSVKGKHYNVNGPTFIGNVNENRVHNLICDLFTPGAMPFEATLEELTLPVYHLDQAFPLRRYVGLRKLELEILHSVNRQGILTNFTALFPQNLKQLIVRQTASKNSNGPAPRDWQFTDEIHGEIESWIRVRGVGTTKLRDIFLSVGDEPFVGVCNQIRTFGMLTMGKLMILVDTCKEFSTNLYVNDGTDNNWSKYEDKTFQP